LNIYYNFSYVLLLEAYRLASKLTPRAAAAGAVNTLKFDADHLIGDNTDGMGLVADIVNNAGINLSGKRILLLGAGGAARGAVLPLLEHGTASSTIANRSTFQGTGYQKIAHDFLPDAQVDCASFLDVAGHFDVIINATSASLNDDVPPISATLFSPQTLAYDMMYGAQRTVFAFAR
jgi:shikimate dehydrogenase